MTYFELFGQPASFEIDKKALKDTLLALQKRHHPDVAVNTAITSDLLNHAFDVLSCDDKRALYLLELQGLLINLDATTQDKAFLTQMMALRIELEEAKETKDMQTIASIKTTLAHLNTNTGDAFADAFAKEDWETATALALKLRFLARLAHAVSEAHLYYDDAPDELYV